MTGGRVVSMHRRLFGLLAVMAVVLSACGGAGTTSPGTTGSTAPSAAASVSPSEASTEPVTIEWWNIGTQDPGKSLNQAMADEYTTAHPNVTINITILENEAFKTKLATDMQAGSAPDLFQSWGGGVLAEQQAAGLVRPIDDDIASWKDTMNAAAMSIYQVDGKQYGIPYNFGLVGFWYNKTLFEKAGISAPPETWDDFLVDVQKLKDADVTPIALAAGDKWPAMFYWAYLSLRVGGQPALEQAVLTGAWDAPAFVTAGTELKKLIDLQPFQKSFLSAVYDNQAATMGNGKAAIELMGQWAPGVEQAQSESKTGIGDALAWFPFPAVTGGAGQATDVFGGADGYAVGKDAPPEAVDFLKYISSLPVANRWGGLNNGTLPPTNGAEASVTDPFLKNVLAKRAESSFAQLYLDQATTPALGAAINDAIQGLFAGQSTPEQVAKAIADAAKAE
jgi:raffinose/stachyose/melibiose transport system substrate-binding protein